MARPATLPAPPQDVAKLLTACPVPAASHVQALRALIYETAADTEEAGQLTETLKWGQPAYLTHSPCTGTTIRLGWDEAGQAVSVFVHCQTTLVKEWRDLYETKLELIGNRQLRLRTDKPLPQAALKHCIAMALTYHSRKKSK
jgi:hypothetical protein